jgi:ABC-2 type transport system permease protein
VVLAWMSVLIPTLAFAALAVLVSIATRSSVAGIGLPVLAGLTMQLYSLVDGPESIRQSLITTAFEAWHGLLIEPPAYGALVYGAMASLTYLAICLAAAFVLLRRRDIGR